VFAQGIVTAVDTRAIGNAIIELGGGRRQVGEKLDLSVGFSSIAPIGTELDSKTPLAVIHAASEAAADRAEKNLLAAISLGDERPPERPVICEILAG
jgi:thymidine phosphorylase